MTAPKPGPSEEQRALERSRTFENLREAFLEEAGLAFRYLYLATIAEYEGFERHAAEFRKFAEGGRTGAHGCLDFLRAAPDPVSMLPVGGTLKNLQAMIETEARQHVERYPRMAETALCRIARA